MRQATNPRLVPLDDIMLYKDNSLSKSILFMTVTQYILMSNIPIQLLLFLLFDHGTNFIFFL
jgi:hypothetical protein